MAKLNNIEALNDALTIAMKEDERIVLFGEDAGFEGGVFRATQGLQEKYGEKRVFDAPIAEATIAGTGEGLGVGGRGQIGREAGRGRMVGWGGGGVVGG